MATAPVALYSDAWRNRYAQTNQYLKYLSVDGLQDRYIHLLDNIVKFAPDGKPHLDGLKADTGWTRRAADLAAETELRGLPASWLPNVEQTILDRPYANVKRALEVWANRPSYQPELSIIKYGRRDHMKDLLERGCLRMTPASNYDDPSLNPAIRDKELEFALYCPPGTVIAMEVEHGSKKYQKLPITGQITQTVRCDNYYVFCASAKFEPRAFDDFGYDSCVLIHDWHKLLDLVKVQRVPAKSINAGSVVYLDPYMPHRDFKSVHVLKHFRYEYQMEWRFYWTDPLPPPPLQPCVLELGNLSSFAELITL